MIHALLLSIALAGQIVGPDEFPRDTAAEFGCQCAYPKEEPDVELKIEWSSPADDLKLYKHPEGDTNVYVVGPPGTYELKSDATVLVYLTLTYLEPGPNYPTDPLDVTRKTQRFIKSYDSQNYSRSLKIVGDEPGPGPGPDPPKPDGTFTGDLRTALASVPASERERLVKTGDGVSTKPARMVVADNCRSVADEAIATGWKADDMVDVWKQRNSSTLPVATLLAWKPFWNGWNSAMSKAGFSSSSTTAEMAKAFRDSASVLSE